jgi:hypothetical protein
MVEEILTAVLSSVATTAILVFLGKTWLETRLKSSIEHEYKKQFELFARELDRKEKVELVADLMAEYLKVPAGETVTREQRFLLTKLSFKSSLWLPAELSIELSKRLQNSPTAKTHAEILLMARKSLIGDESLRAEHITHWGTNLETKGDPVIVRSPQ